MGGPGPKSKGLTPFQTPSAIFGPLAFILDFAGGAAVRAVSECPLRRQVGIIFSKMNGFKLLFGQTWISSNDCTNRSLTICKIHNLKLIRSGKYRETPNYVLVHKIGATNLYSLAVACKLQGIYCYQPNICCKKWWTRLLYIVSYWFCPISLTDRILQYILIIMTKKWILQDYHICS